MIYQPTIFVMGYADMQVSSSAILVYSVAIRWLHFEHAHSICIRALNQLEVWPGDEASRWCYHILTLNGRTHTASRSSLECTRAAKLKLKPTKYKLLREEVEYLSHVAMPNKLKPTTCHLDAVKEFPVPASVKQTCLFLGLVCYYKRVISSFARVV